MKKATLTFLFSIGLLLNLAFDCCQKLSYWNLHSFYINVYNYENGQKTTNSSRIVTDTLALHLYLNAEFMADMMPMNPLMSNCQATSCDPYGGEKGMKDEIGQVIISGNTYVNGQRSSQFLNADALIDGQPISTWLGNKVYNSTFLVAGHPSIAEMNILLTNRPTDKPIHDISVAFVMESGKVIQAITPKITWGANASAVVNVVKEGN